MRRAGWSSVAVVAAVMWLAAMTIYLSRQETPTGWVRGTAVAEETGQPLPRVEIRLRPPGTPGEYEGEHDIIVRTRADGTFRSKRIPAGAYSLQATSPAHRLRATDILIQEGQALQVNLELSPVEPFFYMWAPENVFSPDQTPQVIGEGFVPGGSVEFSLYRVDPMVLFVEKRGALRSVLYTTAPPQHLVLDGNPALTLRKRISVPITKRDVEGIFRQRFDLPVGEPGIYVVAAKADSVQKLEWLMVTRLGLIIKHWRDQALAFVVDLKTGAPVPGATVHFSIRGAEPVSGITDGDGLFQATVPAKEHEEEYESFFAYAEHGGSQAFLKSSLTWSGEKGQERVYAYTDRPVYRPGNEVSFKGIARRFAGVDYTVPQNQPVEVEVRDPRDTLVYRGKLATDRFGSYHANFRLNEEAPTGYYQLVSAVAGERHEAAFKVAAYRKPEYSVEVTTARKRYTRGERIEAKVSAQYYFGAPVAGAEVEYRVMRSPYFFYLGEDDEESYDDSGSGGDYEGYGYGEEIETGRAETGADGVAHLNIPTKRPFQAWGKQEEGATEGEGSDYEYTIAVTVTDPSRKEVTAEGSTLVTQGEFALSLTPASWVAKPGDAADVELRAADYDEKPVRDVRVEVTAVRELWHGRESTAEPVARATVTTDAKGKARFRFTPPEPGFYRIEARARDRRGNEILSKTSLWVTREDYADFRVPYPELEIVADKRVYREGDTAVLLINTKSKGATALVTVEGPQVYERRVVRLVGNSTRVEFKVRHEYSPNFFVAVAFVRDRQFATSEKRLRVSTEARRLRIDIKPDKRRYSPGDEAVYQLRATDWRGRPALAQLSIGVVDESIYAIEEDSTPPMLGFFYPARENSVTTEYSFPELYLDADKSAVAIKVRKRFPDTAYWNPTVVTDTDGRAEIRFTMPDSLTTWRATVRGATLDTAVGEATAEVKTSKDLLVRLEAPRFMVQRDRLTISALVHNYTRSEQALAVWIKAPGLALNRDGSEQRRFALRPNDVRREDWQVEASTPGDKEITVYAKARSGLSDAMALTIPALPHGRERVESRSGAVQTQATERLSVRRDSVPGASELRIRLAPSIASVVLGALEYLAQYPYGCTEQTMSAFLPDVIVARALRELNLSNPRLEKQLPDMVQKGLNRLYSYQHDDGGWGWWRYDNSDPWMTAYVVFGLVTAKRNGFSLNENALNRGLEWLSREARPAPPTPLLAYGAAGTPLLAQADRLYVLYVLSLAARDGLVDQQVTQFYRNLNTLDGQSLGLLTATLLERGRTADAKVAADRLWQRANETQALAWWKGRQEWDRAGDTETTGLALKALLALNPNDPRIMKIVRWLVLNRQGNCWVSTRDTAFVLFALTDFLKRSQELQPDYEAQVTLNGKTILSRHFTRDDLFAPEVEVKVSGGALHRGTNTVQFTKEGTGNLYYTLTLRQFVGQGDLPEVITGAGITVQRSYYRVVSQRDPRTGVIVTSPSPDPVTDFRSGEPILARLKITSDKAYDYVIVEDPLPAGCEVSEQGDLEPWEWNRWWSDMDIRDEKVAVFARRLPAGVSTIEYHLRPQIPGDYHVMPTEVYSMYNPMVRGSGAEARVRLR